MMEWKKPEDNSKITLSPGNDMIYNSQNEFMAETN